MSTLDTYLNVVSFATFGVVGSILGLLALLLGPMISRRQAILLNVVLVLVLLTAGGLSVWADLPTGAAACIALGLLWGTAWLLRSEQARDWLRRGVLLVARPRVQAGLLLACSPLILVAALHHEEQTCWRDLSEYETSANEVTLQRDLVPAKVTALTDSGTMVQLFQIQENNPLLLERAETRLSHDSALKMRLIRTTPPSYQSNCHGWVFTGGRYWVRGTDVDEIIRENEYQQVTYPEVGDLVVYRNGTEVLHTAVVRLATPEGNILLESKWGPLGTYLHTPRDQNYSTEWTYHRSSRLGHLLRGLDEPGFSSGRLTPVW